MEQEEGEGAECVVMRSCVWKRAAMWRQRDPTILHYSIGGGSATLREQRPAVWRSVWRTELARLRHRDLQHPRSEHVHLAVAVRRSPNITYYTSLQHARIEVAPGREGRR